MAQLESKNGRLHNWVYQPINAKVAGKLKAKLEGKLAKNNAKLQLIVANNVLYDDHSTPNLPQPNLSLANGTFLHSKPSLSSKLCHSQASKGLLPNPQARESQEETIILIPPYPTLWDQTHIGLTSPLWRHKPKIIDEDMQELFSSIYGPKWAKDGGWHTVIGGETQDLVPRHAQYGHVDWDVFEEEIYWHFENPTMTKEICKNCGNPRWVMWLKTLTVEARRFSMEY